MTLWAALIGLGIMLAVAVVIAVTFIGFAWWTK